MIGATLARGQTTIAVTLSALVTALALSVASAPAGATTGGRVDGTVTHGADRTPVVGLEVALRASVDGEEADVSTTVTDADGRFVFDEVPTGAPAEIVLSYDHAEYRSGPLAVDPETPTTVELEVFDSTSAPDDVVITSWVVWVDGGNGVAVQHDLQVDNRGARTYLGATLDGEAGRAVLTVPLSAGASGLRFLGRFTECCATMHGTDYVHTSPLPPGTTVGTLRYSIESLDTLTLPVPLPVASLTMMVPTGVTVGTERLTLAGDIVSQGNTYAVYTAEGIEAGEVLELSFRGLTVRDIPTWQLAVAAAIATLVVVAVASRVRRREPPQPSTLRAEFLADEIALLDVGFEQGMLGREAYESLRAARKTELAEARPSPHGGDA